MIAVALQWQPLVTRVVAGLLAASLPGPAEQAVSDMISLGCSEPDIYRTAQAAANLNVQQHPCVTPPSSGTDRVFRTERHGDKEDGNRNVNQILAILQKHVCDGKSRAVSVTSRHKFNSAQYDAHLSATRIKLSATNTGCLIVAKSVAEVVVCRTQGAFSIRFVVFCLQGVVLKAMSAAVLSINAGSQVWGVNEGVAGLHCASFQVIMRSSTAAFALFAHLLILLSLFCFVAAVWND